MIYTLSSATSFCDTLAEKWLKQKQDITWGLSHLTVIVPTNRAAKTLKEAFLRQANGKTLLLPKIISFADMDFLAPQTKPAIAPLARQMFLSKLIKKKQPMSEDKAFLLASSLAELIDQMHHYDVDFNALKEIAPDNFASHWQQTLTFLEIIETYWPQILAERGELDPALRQILLVENLINQWQKNPPKNPMIALGFTGGLPIIERFLKALNSLPNSDIYIPNIDMLLSDDDWEQLDATHPQFYIKRLLDTLEVKRKDIVCEDEITPRFELLSMALKPAAATSNWFEQAKSLSKDCVQNVGFIECKTPQTEAFEIACRLRKVLQTPEKTAALVTTDRSLARRVRIQMARWGIELDDSAGTPLSRTPIGTFLILLADAAVSQKSKDLLALLKHPLALDGQDFNTFRKKIHQLEKQARHDRKSFNPDLKTDLSPFMNLFVNPVRQPLEVILRTHLDAAQSLAASSDKTGAERLWDKEAGNATSQLLTELLSYADTLGDIEPVTYPAFLTAVLNSVTVRPKYGMHPRLDILGPIEARLQQPDEMIIGGVNEDSFPQLPETDAWINRPMRQVCNLPSPDEKIGIAAQDFMHLMQAPNVILTRALKVDGTPSIASRWWSRLEAVLQSAEIAFPLSTEKFAHLLQNKNGYMPFERPMPCPPLDARPKELSISDISTFLNDPYSVYAKRILQLYKLEELDAPISSANFGNAVHNALALYLSTDEQTLNQLLTLGEKTFKDENIDPQTNPFMWEKFKRICQWFVKQESQPKPIKHLLETNAKMHLSLPKGDMILKGRADRIDIFSNKKAAIIDYKTGYAPSKAQVCAGYAPQLPLEALMLQDGCFEGLPQKDYQVTDLSYWRLIGKAKSGEITHVLPDEKKMPLSDFWNATMQKLTALLMLYQEENTPYPVGLNAGKYNDYAHLERTTEWKSEDEEQE